MIEHSSRVSLSADVTMKWSILELEPSALTYVYGTSDMGVCRAAKRNTAAKRKTLLRFARPPFTFWVMCRKNNSYVLR